MELKRKLKSKSSHAQDVDDQSNHNEGVSSAKMAKLSNGYLYKPPTNKELNELKDTENLFHSSLFRMQITELLKEVLMKDKNQVVDKFLHLLKAKLVSLPSGKSYQLMDQEWLSEQSITIPIIQKPYKISGQFQFVAPKIVTIIGSYLLGTCIKPDLHVDIDVEMPKGSIEQKDRLNYRYLRKRALYLCHIAQVLSKDDFVSSVKFSYHHGNTLLPILVVKPAGKAGKHYTIRIHASPGVLKTSLLTVASNNIRKKWYHGNHDGPTDGTEELCGPATPHYNTTLLTEILSKSHLQFINDLIKDSTEVKHGIALLKIWLHQRELDLGRGSFSGFIMSMYVCYLLKTGKLNRQMSSYQIIRITLLHLGTSDWMSEPITLQDVNKPSDIQTHEYLSHFPVVFVDNSGLINLCADMTKQMFFRVQDEAKLSVEHLSDYSVNGFECLVMKSVPFYQKFDIILHISDNSSFKNSVLKLNMSDKLMDLNSDVLQVVSSAVLDVLSKALGQRIKLMQTRLQPPTQWNISDKPPIMTDESKISIGFIIDTDYCYSILDKGPPADTEEAVDFRSFWGEKSDLRRFQDSSICEAVVWPAENLAERRSLISQISKYILQHQCSIPRTNVRAIGRQLDSLLRPQQSDKCSITYGSGEEQIMDVIRVYDSLCKQLRSLDDLPLTINSLSGTSPTFRFAEVFPPVRSQPIKSQTSTWMPVLKVICLMEGSGKWPEEKDAICRMKAAFHIKLGQLLEEQCKLKTHPHPEYVDVYKEGFVFRVVIGHLMEISVRKTIVSPDGKVKTCDTDDGLDLEREVIVLPKLSSAIHGLQQKHNSFTVAVRLTKRWISSQLLARHIPDVAIELIVASLYTTPAPFQVPNNPLVAFMRVLYLLSTHDWNINPLIVNLNEELTKDDYKRIEHTFNKNRTTLPLMFISTPYEKHLSTWTRQKPVALVLNRLCLLSRESLKLLKSQLHETMAVTKDKMKMIFRPALEPYDVVIHLKKNVLTRGYQAVDSDSQIIPTRYVDGLKPQNSEDIIVDFDPVEYYLKELEDAFGDIAVFFHDRYGGDIVGVLWKPNVFNPQPFKIQKANFCMIDSESSGDVAMAIPNKETILGDFRIFGKGVVEKIVLKGG